MSSVSAVNLPRPAERVAIVSLLLVFLCGGVVGAVVMSYWVHPGLHGSAPGGASLSMSTREWKQQLDLTDDQMRQLTSILDDFSHYYDYLLADGNSRVMQILNPEQKVKYQRMIRAHKK
jgi:Spy/CpxP family protein refolding chaperone